MPSELIRATTLRGFESLVCELGGEPGKILKDSGISPFLLSMPESFIHFQSYCQLMELAAEQTATPEFGLLLGEKQNLSTLGAMGVAVQQSPSQTEAMDIFRRYFHTHNQCASISVRVYEGVTQLTHTTVTASQYIHTQAKMKSISLAVSILRLMHEKNWRPIEVWFDFSPIGDKRVFEKILGAPVVFDQPESCVSFQSTHIKKLFSNADSDPTLRRILLNHLNTQASEHNVDLSTQVTKFLQATLPSGDCSKEKTAASLSMSPRTLQRKLAEENATFRGLLDAARKNLVQHYLAETELSMTEISEIVGYKDISAFSRAFKHWYGVAPQTWRKNVSDRMGSCSS